MRTAAILGMLAFVGWADPAQACRCAPRPLADYYAEASHVFFATLQAEGESSETQQRVAVQPEEPLWKGSLPLPALSTGSSSASCGLDLAEAGRFLVFAQADPENPGQAQVNTCNGTRRFDPAAERVQGFEDVPPKFVVSQLAALWALEGLLARAAYAGDRLIGLLDLAPLAHGGHTTVRSEAKQAAPAIARLDSLESIPTLEASYEFPAAQVLERNGDWARIRLDAKGQSGWVRAGGEGGGTYWSYEELIEKRLSYLVSSWDGAVWPSPGAGIPHRIHPWPEALRDEMPVNVLQQQNLAGSLWLEVEILKHSPCDGGEPGTRMRGWIPAYTASGEPAAWYYSRGC